MSLALRDFLCHILNECNFIVRVCGNLSKDEFLTKEVETRAVVRSLEIIGEATKKL